MAALTDVLELRRGDAEYPDSLERLHRPPERLFARGRLELLRQPMLGVVGTRRCTRDASEFAYDVAHGVAMADGVVVSGLALGIDGAAHAGALPNTIAVLGAGVDVVQPPSHRQLHERIAADGLLLTEYPPGTLALPFHFPDRNRIIAALSTALLVVQAPVRSGALITAEHAWDIGVDVLAVPGPPRRRANVGSNELLRDGAGVVLEPRDALDALGLAPPRPKRRAQASLFEEARAEAGLEAEGPREPQGIGADALALWRAADEEPRHIDELARNAGLGAAPSLNALLELEIMGLVRRAPGQRYARAV